MLWFDVKSAQTSIQPEGVLLYSKKSGLEVTTMATVEQLIKQYETDKQLQAEVAEILADGKVSMMEFMQFTKKHDVAISLEDLPKYLEQAKKLGFM